MSDVLNRSRASIPSILRNVGRSGDRKVERISLWAEIVRSKQIAVPGGNTEIFLLVDSHGRRGLLSKEPEAARDLHPNRFPKKKKKKKLLYHRGWRRDFSLSWNRRFPHAFHFLRFSPKLYYSHCSLFEASSSKQPATIISISSGNNFISRFYFLAIESRFLDFIRRSVVSVAARTATSLGKIVRASTHHGYSIHPVTQEISRFIRGKAAIGRTNPPLR